MKIFHKDGKFRIRHFINVTDHGFLPLYFGFGKFVEFTQILEVKNNYFCVKNVKKCRFLLRIGLKMISLNLKLF